MPPSVIQSTGTCTLYRSLTLDRQFVNEETREIEFSGSSEFPARRFGFTEILSHAEGAIRTERLDTVAAILKNHQPENIVAAITGWRLEDGQLIIRAKFTTTQAGEDAFTEVKEGALKGVSVGYQVHKWEVDEEKDEYRAIDWEPFEFSFTPIPVDPSVGVGRSAEESETLFYKSLNLSPSTRLTLKGHSMPPSNQNPAGEPANTNDDASASVEPSTPAPAPAQRSIDPTPAPTAPVIDAAAIASQVRADAAHIAGQAEGLGLEASAYMGMERAAAAEKMLADLAARDSAKPTIQVPDIQMGESHEDKRNDFYVDQLLNQGQGTECLMRYANELGVGVESRMDLAHAILGKGKFARALETSASLGNVTILAGDKAMINGYDSYKPWWNQVASLRQVPDFKLVHSAGLSLGGWNYPGEGVPLVDGTVDDAGSSGAVSYGGLVLHLTKEAIINDDLDLFFDRLRNIGRNARREEDKIIASTLSGFVFSGAHAIVAPYDLAGLKVAWTAFAKMTDPSGELIGLEAAKVLLPPELYIAGLETTTTALGEATNRIFADGDEAIQPINGKHLTDANDWYMCADPMDSNGIQLLKLRGHPTPLLVEIDSGNTIARKWRVEYPLGVLISETVAGNPVGIIKSTNV